MSSLCRRLAARLGPLALGALCALGPGCAHTSTAGTRGILLDCDVAEAGVYVDDYYLQHARRWTGKPMPLRPGPHRIELVADGYYTYYGEFVVGESGFVPVRVHLRKSLD